MWRAFPIQTRDTKGEDCSILDPSFQFDRHDTVQVRPWKDVEPSIREWCVTLWKQEFGTVRTPLKDTDLVGWIPGKGTIVATRGYWIGTHRSRNAVYISHLVVVSSYRSEGLARQLIPSISNEACKAWGHPMSFLFEVDTIPASLKARGAVPVCRYSYVWVPFRPASETRQWTRLATVPLDTQKGFHGGYTGWEAYKHASTGAILVLDANQDIVWYTSWMALGSFDGTELAGAYCRVFTPFGTSVVFAQNTYLVPSSGMSDHYILG
jgi:hypothetical protein